MPILCIKAISTVWELISDFPKKENNNSKNLIMTLFLRSNIKIIKLKNCLNC